MLHPGEIWLSRENQFGLNDDDSPQNYFFAIIVFKFLQTSPELWSMLEWKKKKKVMYYTLLGIFKFF